MLVLCGTKTITNWLLVTTKSSNVGMRHHRFHHHQYRPHLCGGVLDDNLSLNSSSSTTPCSSQLARPVARRITSPTTTSRLFASSISASFDDSDDAAADKDSSSDVTDRVMSLSMMSTKSVDYESASTHPTSTTPAVVAVDFPRWLRLELIVPVSLRQEVTSLVADAINSKSGGYLSQCNMLSDMATSILIEDLEPTKLFKFIEYLQDSIPDMKFTQETISNLHECEQALSDSSASPSSNSPLPDTVMSILRLTWKDATGTLKQDIPSVPG